MIHLKAFTLAIACAAVSLTACGSDSDRDPSPPVTTQILSDPALDGDIEQTSLNSFNVVQGMSPGVQSVFAGIDPVLLTEFRTFLDFPLEGPKGVPGNAIIESAFLDIYVNNLSPITGSIPIRIDLVSFTQPMVGTDFDVGLQPPLASMTVVPAFSRSDVGTNVSIDVTALMVEAQRQNVNDFQLRVMEDLGPAIDVLMEINDTTGANRASLAPALTVTYH